MNGKKEVDFIEEESWLRQPGETNAAFHAFCLYRDFGGDRSIKKALEANGLPFSRSGIWAAWSKRFQWVRRTQEYDNHLDHIRQKEREEAFREREKKHMAVTCKMLDIVEKRLEDFHPDQLDQKNVTDWMKAAVETERKNFGDILNDEADSGPKQLQLNFFEDFNGV